MVYNGLHHLSCWLEIHETSLMQSRYRHININTPAVSLHMQLRDNQALSSNPDIAQEFRALMEELVLLDYP